MIYDRTMYRPPMMQAGMGYADVREPGMANDVGGYGGGGMALRPFMPGNTGIVPPHLQTGGAAQPMPAPQPLPMQTGGGFAPFQYQGQGGGPSGLGLNWQNRLALMR